ncbi:deoxyribodipyrimidine photolyase [Nitrincola tibetensis]|uniref:Deoxyribodipyrimidine photolyase n=1 Tax=Nitrincola tibetensis TaxID=2219697 RepID=A0A364NLS1_9GAMM|nr:deoxyribodipyrimidine photo-lyase [Nitrincola tibetensis]RAU18043.1 deoxyribodipyrimidine photolyase [Nitrincola tibetensis]
MQTINLVWLKRDLRLLDHVALAHACSSEHPLCIFYTFEPSLLTDPHISDRHQIFIVQSLSCLSTQLKQLGHQLYVFWCDMPDLLMAFQQSFVINCLLSHEEIGLDTTYQRDKRVKQLCAELKIPWIEYPQVAVRRGQNGRKGWKKFADRYLKEPIAQVHFNKVSSIQLSEDHPLQKLRCRALPKPWLEANENFQKGGELAALDRLAEFLNTKLASYSKSISQPMLSIDNSSRLSAYLAYGNLSIRYVVQRLKSQSGADRSKRALYSRLRWHCHFIQKFESNCVTEFKPLNPGYVELLNTQKTNQSESYTQQYQAWSQGETGYPMVDACMRALLTTGYLNFRMRAMLVSVACHHLQLDWKDVAEHLARCFLDFDPGIHYPQIQMQVGLTGYNTLRIYNPLQQSLHQDPDAAFIRRYVPEIAHLPIPLIHHPWLLTEMEKHFYPDPHQVSYPQRMFNHEETGSEARQRLWAWKKHPKVQANVPNLLKNQVE